MGNQIIGRKRQVQEKEEAKKTNVKEGIENRGSSSTIHAKKT